MIIESVSCQSSWNVFTCQFLLLLCLTKLVSLASLLWLKTNKFCGSSIFLCFFNQTQRIHTAAIFFLLFIHIFVFLSIGSSLFELKIYLNCLWLVFGCNIILFLFVLLLLRIYFDLTQRTRFCYCFVLDYLQPIDIASAFPLFAQYVTVSWCVIGDDDDEVA